MDGSLPQVLRFVLRHTGPASGLLDEDYLDGGGYPRGLKAADIALETRIITTADIFDAITAERPYRGAVPVEKTLAIMADTVGTAIDATCFAHLKKIIRASPEFFPAS